MPTAPPTPIATPDSSPESIVKGIIKSLSKVPGVLNKNRSVTGPDRKESIAIIDSVISAAKLLLTKLPDPDATVASIPEPDAHSVLDVVREEFAKLRSELQQQPTPASYAAAAAKPKRPAVKTPASRPAIIVESGDTSVKSGKDVLNAWRTGVSFKDACFAPAKVQLVSNNKLRVEFDSDIHRDETLRKLESVSSVKAERAKRLRPLIIVKGVSKDSKSDELISLIRRQNPSVDAAASADADIKLRFLRSNRNDALYNAVVEVTPAVRVALLELQRVNVNHQRVRVDEYSAFIQCYRCLQFGHTKAKCTSECTPCSHCASKDHSFDACTHKQDASHIKCFNCEADNKKHGRTADAAHSATSIKQCPKIKSMLKLISQRTEYGV